MLGKLFQHGDTCLANAKGDKRAMTKYGKIAKGDLITKEDYDLMIHQFRQSIVWMKYATESYEKAITMLESLRK